MPVDQDALRAALHATAESHGPGLFGLVTDAGEVVFQGSVGVADLDRPRPLSAGDRFRIGSITKTFTAALVLALADDGVLALDDPLPRWLPGLVPDADVVTVDLLLRMRSGLPDYAGAVLGDPPDLRALDRYYAPEQLVGLALDTGDRHAPGERFRYCNTDYVLLGLIVERATGQRVDAQLWQRVSGPLGLVDTTLPTSDPYLRGPHASGHVRETADSPYREFTTFSPSEAWTAGGMVSTATDLVAFLDGLFGGRLLSDAALARMTAPTEPLDDWRSRTTGMIRYAVGDTVAYGQHGGAPGFTTLALRTTAGRCVVLWQNGIDLHHVLSSDAPFITAALS
jgi:D-alanyl-D-alanine carboxypeptidase